MIGELAALTAACLWATSSVIYRFLGQNIPPLTLNICKGIIAIALILLTLAVSATPINLISTLPLSILALSGAIGIGLGDTAFFLALNSLGARRTLVLETLSPPLGALLAFGLMGEVISSLAWLGILITLTGVITVIGEQTSTTKTQTRSGIFWAIAAALAQAMGAVLSRFALLDSEINPLESSLIRLLGGVAIAVFLGLFLRRSSTLSWNMTGFSFSLKTAGIIFVAAFGSTYLGIWLQQTSLKFAPTGIAQTLLATSPLFAIPIAVAMGEKVSVRSIFGAIIALAGISLLFLAR